MCGLQEDVIDVAYKAFMKEVEASRDFDTLVQCHRTFLRSLKAQVYIHDHIQYRQLPA
jgi:hypothetical protein